MAVGHPTVCRSPLQAGWSPAKQRRSQTLSVCQQKRPRRLVPAEASETELEPGRKMTVQKRTLMHGGDWRHEASCRDMDPELFFPVGTAGPALTQIAEAKAVCRRCPVAEQCLAWALKTRQYAGVWGGLSEDERRAVQRGCGRTGARTA